MTSATMDQAGAAQVRRRPWWMTVILGFAALIIGAILLWAPAKNKVNTYELLVAFLGIYWVIIGIMDLVSMFVDHSMWGWKLFIGIVSILAGGWILMYPIAAGLALPQIFVLVLGIWAFIYGIMLLLMAFRGGGWGAGILGVLGIIFGLDLMINYAAPGMGLAMLWTAAVFGVIGGIFMIVRGFMDRTA
jgi:uncharacterized membrane protein HdeD (DUF308 family)